MLTTKKLYLRFPYKASCNAVIKEVSIDNTALRFDQTIAFPEGGGQASDSGMINTPDGSSIAFQHVFKIPGRPVILHDFPMITVDNPIYHVIPSRFIQEFTCGMEVEIKIDIQKRASISVYHSAAHVVLLATAEVRPDAVVRGCSINDNGARFDFAVTDRFEKKDLADISSFANGYVERNLPIDVYPHADEPEARYWKCDSHVIPCGGTHIPSTGMLGLIHLRRKRLAKNMDRIIIRIPDIRPPVEIYEA